VLFLLVASMGLVQTPVKMSQITTDEDTYETAVWIDQYAAEKGIEYPENYVLSKWGQSRTYNYFVSGQARSYQFARGQYRTLMSSQFAQSWTNSNAGKVGFVVTNNESYSENSVHTRLHDQLGSSDGQSRGTGRYRAIYIGDSGEIKVFQLVPGALISGEGPPNTNITVSTMVDMNNNRFEYTRQTRSDSGGEFEVRVSYPGEYTDGNNTYLVNETAVTTENSQPT